MSDEKKITLEDLEDLLDDDSGSTGRRRLTFQTIFTALVLNWQWFLLSLVICFCGALIYLRYAEPVYEVSARMLIKDQPNKRRNTSQMLAGVEDLGFLSNSTGIDNEMEVLQSRVLLRDVVKDLKLYTEYYREGRIHDLIAYNSQPVSVDLDPLHLDSMDYNLLEKVQQLKLRISREDGECVVSGEVFSGGKEPTAFQRRFKSFPAAVRTSLGTITLTRNAGRPWQDGDIYLVTIRPPMLVATQILGRLSVEPTSKLTSIALLTLKDKNYRRGMDILRQLTVCYNRQANADKNEVALRTEEFINERMSKLNEELGSTESEIQQYKQQNSVTSLSDASMSLQLSNQFSAKLSEANAQVEILDYMREFVSNPKNKYQIIPSNVGVTDGASTALINSYNQAVQDRSRLLKSASEQAPQVQTLTATIDELQQSIQTALLQARRSAVINRQGVLSQYEKFQGRVSAAPVQERVLIQEGRQQNVKSTLYMLLLQKREENSIALAATADNGKLIDEPLIQGQVSPKRTIVLAGSLLLGFLVPAVILFVLSLFRYKIEGREDVMQYTDLPIIADVAIASENVKQKAGIVVQANRNNQIDEVFRSLRTNIQFMLEGDQKVILFTSSTSGEGKTFNAANVAVSFALLGKKVILCGLDIRKPTLGRLFDISERTAGITTLLTMGRLTDDDIRRQIVQSGVNDHLDLLLAGAIPPNPTELLARDSFGQVVDYLRSHYDYVIFDTAPVGLVTDTIQIAQKSDLTVFVCRADYTPKSAFGLLNKLASDKKVPNPCIVLNAIDMSRRKYGYYYGYGRYGKYGRYGYGKYGYGKYGYGKYGYGSYGHYGNYGLYADSHYGTQNDDSIKK